MAEEILYPAPSLAIPFNAPSVVPGKRAFYVAACPAGTGLFSGAELQIDRGADFEAVATITAQAVIGQCIGALPNFSGTPDDLQAISLDVDLYSDDDTLESVPEGEARAEANAAWIGGEFVVFVDAEKLAGFANRWRLSNFLRGRRDTLKARAGHQEGEPFILVTSAIVEVSPIAEDVNVERIFRCPTFGYPEESAATFAFTYLEGPSNVFAQGTGDAVTVGWTAGANPSEQSVEYRLNGASEWTSESVAPTAEEIEITGLENGKRYEFRVVAVIDRQTYRTAPVSVRTPEAEGVKNVRFAVNEAIDLTEPPTTVQGKSMRSGDGLLIYAQPDAVQHGIYEVSAPGQPLARRRDSDAPGDFSPGQLIVAFDGTNAGIFMQTTQRRVTPGQTPVFFVKLTADVVIPEEPEEPDDLPANLKRIFDADGAPIINADGAPVVIALGALVTNADGAPLIDADGAAILSE
jgi:hypothetical protein